MALRNAGAAAVVPVSPILFFSSRSRHTRLQGDWSSDVCSSDLPTAEVNGIWGGYTGAGHKTIVASEGHAKVSFRLVPGQEPGDIQRKVESWLGTVVPPGIEWAMTWYGPGVRPCVTPLDHPALQAVTRSMAAAFGTEVLYTREGGSGPEADLQDVTGAPVVFLGISLPVDGWHAPNEKVDVSLLLKGAEAAAHLWSDL